MCVCAWGERGIDLLGNRHKAGCLCPRKEITVCKRVRFYAAIAGFFTCLCVLIGWIEPIRWLSSFLIEGGNFYSEELFKVTEVVPTSVNFKKRIQFFCVVVQY